jgi:hypothetical protein
LVLVLALTVQLNALGLFAYLWNVASTYSNLQTTALMLEAICGRLGRWWTPAVRTGARSKVMGNRLATLQANPVKSNLGIKNLVCETARL